MRREIIVLAFTILTTPLFAQVNLQSGAPEQSFPLISYVDGKAGLSMNVNLNYSGGNGLLVNDVASNTGTGWNLDVGGFISRIQNGEPDDQMEYTVSDFSAEKDHEDAVRMLLKNYPAGFLYNPNATNGCNAGLNYYPVFTKQTVYKELNRVAADTEQDKFFFRMNGRSGVFIIGKNMQATTLGDSRVKIAFTLQDMTSQGIRTRINGFTIITEDGIKYSFSQKALTHICRYKYSYRDPAGNWAVASGNPPDDEYDISRYWGYELAADERPYIINTWYLSEIENANTGQKILFNYEDIRNELVSSLSVNHSRDLNDGPGGMPRDIRRGRDRFNRLSNPETANAYSWNDNWLSEFKAGPTSLFYSRSIAFTKRLKSIQLPNGGTINLTYSGIARADMKGDNALERLSYIINGQSARTYQFQYGYFFKNTIRPYTSGFSGYESKFARLCLLSVQKLGTGEDDATEPPYVFNYYTGSTVSADDIVPARNFLAQDHWGYFNGSISGLPMNEDHDFLGNEETQYFKTVLPRYKNPKSGLAKNGLLHKVTFPTGGSIEYKYEQIKPSVNILPASYEQLAGGVSVSQTIVFDGEDHSKDVITDFSYVNTVNQSSHWGDEAPEYYNLSWTEYNRKWLGKLTWNKAGLSYPEAGVNPQVLQTMFKMAVGFAISYSMNLAIAALPPPFNVIGQAVVVVYQLIKLIATMTGSAEFHRFTLSNKSNIQVNALPGYYSRVETKVNSSSGYNGKTVYEFTSLADYPALVPKFQWPFIQNQRLASWIYGLPKKVTVYDKNNLQVKESENLYNYIVQKKADVNNQSCKCATVNKRDIKGIEWVNNYASYNTWGQVHWMIPQPYFVYTGRTDLAASTEKSYVNGQLYYSDVSNTITDPMTLLQKGKIIYKDAGSLIIQLTYYPTDYSIPGSPMERLVQMNAIHTPIATETWLKKTGVAGMVLLDATITQYQTYTFGARVEVKPSMIWKLKTKTPVPQSTAGTHNPSVLIRNPSLFHLKSWMNYDNDGNLIEVTDEQNTTSFINDYKSRSVVASVANATASHIAYTSFEADGKGGWNFNPAFIKTTGGITGFKEFKLGFDASLNQTSTISRSGLDPAKTYVITWWTQNTEPDYVMVNGEYGENIYTQQATGRSLYKKEITGVTQVTLSGDAVIDELRLYPQGTLMSTVAYKEGVGKVTECDANNRLVYYEYDALGRLKLIRDQNRNIIKTYEYNYKR
ncbi:MAG: hypothetical protein JNM88_14100 [Chitinophagaceae bacterium]|nr:hypothetical protein [Chitinophagaceae bacterium]